MDILSLMKKMRLDTLLVERGLCESEEEALRVVLAHEVKVDDVYATSAAAKVSPDADVWVKERGRFVTRGGVKLQAALDAFGQTVEGLDCADIGCSHGGFTDCLLQAGAASVAAIDVGYGDLNWKLRQNPRVRVFERTNIRTATPEEYEPIARRVAEWLGIGNCDPTTFQSCRLMYWPSASADSAARSDSSSSRALICWLVSA